MASRTMCRNNEAMGNMIGANPQQLRDLAAFMTQRADLFDHIGQDLGQRLYNAGWCGPDAEQMRARWDAELRPKVRSAVQALTEASKVLERHAREQELASDGGAGGGSSSGGAGCKPPCLPPWFNVLNLSTFGEIGKVYGKSGFLDQGRRTAVRDKDTGKWSVTEIEPEADAKNRPQKSTDMPKTWKDQLKPQFRSDVLAGHYESAYGQTRKSSSGEYGVLAGTASAVYKSGYTETDARVAVGNDGVEASAAVEIGLVKAGAGAAGTALGGVLAGRAEAEAYAAIEAKGKLALGKEGLKASGEAFIGAKATGEVGGSVAGVGGKVVGEAWLGAGIAGEVKAGLEDGKLAISASGGFGFGIGARLGFQFTIDVKQTIKTFGDCANALGVFYCNPSVG